jgi:Spy/CpxP family protein refolding chaperone
MNSENRSKWQIRLATLSIFLLGAMAGAFALNAYNLWFGTPPQPLTRAERLQKLSKQLDLETGQTAQIQQIFGDTREKMKVLKDEDEPRVQEIRNEMDGKLQKVLSAEQWQEFLKVRQAKREEERQRNAEK